MEESREPFDSDEGAGVKNIKGFKKLLTDFVDELNTTFPEFHEDWKSWTSNQTANLSEEEIDTLMQSVYDHCIEFYPKQFFDILYKNEKAILEATEPVHFLPMVDFRKLFRVEGVSEKTKTAIWNYLQLILFQIVGDVKDKSSFGNACNIAENMGEEELFKKLSETIENMTHIFEENGSENTGETNIPNPEDLHNHLKGIFDGKIGSIAKEMAEEITNDLESLLGEDFKDIKSTQDVIKKLFKDPSKLTAIIKTVSEKLNAKLQTGELNQEELLKETQDIFGKMKGFEGMMNDKRLKELMRMLTKLATGGAKGDGDFNLEEMFKDLGERMNKQQVVYQGQGVRTGGNFVSSSFKDKLKNRMQKKKEAQAMAILEAQKRMEEAEKNYKPFEFEEPKPTKGRIQDNVFTVEGEAPQLTSSAPKKKKKSKK